MTPHLNNGTEQKEMKTEIEMKREDLALYIYEGHKDAYGMKGRHYGLWTEDGSVAPEWTLERLEAEAASIEAAVVRSIEEDKQREDAAIVRFEMAVAATIAIGASDRETAIRWLADANGDLYGDRVDNSSFEYSHGLPYGYLKGEDTYGSGWKQRLAKAY